MKTPSRFLFLPPSPNLSPTGKDDPGGFTALPHSCSLHGSGSIPLHWGNRWRPSPCTASSFPALLPAGCVHPGLPLLSQPSQLNVSKRGCLEVPAASEIPSRLPLRSGFKGFNCSDTGSTPLPGAAVALGCLHAASETGARGRHGPRHRCPQVFKKCRVRVIKPPSPSCMA